MSANDAQLLLDNQALLEEKSRLTKLLNGKETELMIMMKKNKSGESKIRNQLE